MNYGDFFAARQGFNGLISEVLPARTALALSKMAVKVENHLQEFEKVRKNLLEQYKITPETKQDTDDFKEYVKAIEEHLKTEVEWNEPKIEISFTFRGKEIGVSPAALIQAEKFIEVKEVSGEK